MEETTPSGDQLTTEQTAPLSNADRLRLHLTDGSLSRTLLEAWIGGSQAEATKRMLDAVNNFQPKKQVKDDQAAPAKN
jgi:hypothetical protein